MMRRLFTVSETALADAPDPHVPAHPRPVDAAPAVGAARLAGLAGHQRRRPDQPVPAVRRGDPAGQPRSAGGHHRRHARLLLAADAGRAAPRSCRWCSSSGSSSAGSARVYATVRERIGDDARRDRARASSARRSIRAYGDRRAHRAAARRGDRQAAAGPAARAADQRRSACSSASWRPGWRSAGVVVVGVLLGVDGTLSDRAADRVPVPGDAVHPAGAGRHRGAQRGAERDRRLAPGAGHARTSRRTSPTRARRAGRCRAGRVDVRFDHVRFAYPGGPEVLTDVDLEIPAQQPGRGGRRDRQRQDHVRQAADPADGPDRRRRCCCPGCR